MFRDLHITVIAAVGGLLATAPAFAASFDCAKANAPVERAICANPFLSSADEGVALFYRHLLSPTCRGIPGVETLADEQRAWVAATRQAFRPGEDGEKALAAAYAARQMALDPLVDACGARRSTSTPAKISPLEANGSALPFAEGASPEIGWRINQAVFMRMIDLPSPARRDAARATLAAATRVEEGRLGRTADISFAVRRNDTRVLVLEFSAEGCGAYCEYFTEQLMFDTRTGREVPTADLLTRDGARTLAQRTFAHQVREGRAILTRARRAQELDRESDEEGTYRQCLKQWAEWGREGAFLSPLWLDDKGRWQVHVDTCSAHVNRPHSLLDELHLPMPMTELRPLLSAYGRSLLLGESDVRSPVEVPGRCEGLTLPLALTPPTAPGPRFASDGETATWLLSDGQPVIWRLGGASQTDAVTAQPWRPGERYVALARGQFFSAGLREDGSLWTWGSNYQGRLGVTGPRESDTPLFVLDDVAQVSVDTNTGLALRRDGTLWVWGDAPSIAPGQARGTDAPPNPAPRRLFDGVAQAVHGPQGDVIALRRDGSMWRIGGPAKTRLDRPLQPPEKLGDGYVRLAGPHAEAAWRADGWLWAWGVTLTHLLPVNEPDLPPTPVAREVVQVLPNAAEHQTVLLKSDGSVWAKQGWGGTYALRRAACGYRQLAHAGYREVLGWRVDGSLTVWRHDQARGDDGDPGSLFSRAPDALGTGYTALWPADHLNGNVSTPALVLRGADELWATRAEPRSSEPRSPVRALLQRVRVAP